MYQIIFSKNYSRNKKNLKRLKFEMKYFNDVVGDYIPISPQVNGGFQQYVDQIDLRGVNDIWRILFKEWFKKSLTIFLFHA